MKNKVELIEIKDTEEIAQRLYELCEGMDYMDYEDTKEQTIGELEEALYHLKTVAQNEHNKSYFRDLYNILQLI